MQIYTVKSGDTLYAIARRHGSTVETLAAVNQLDDPARLIPGQSLLIPGGSGSSRRGIEVNAYAYPFISAKLLDEVLPYCTSLCPFSWRFNAEGELLPIRDEPLIRAARETATAPMLTVTNLDDSGFSAALGHAVLTDAAVQERVLGGIQALLREKDYSGVNYNFEYLYPFDRDSYSQFVARTAELLHPLGYFVTTAIAARESAGEQNYLNAAHDYAAHGRYADRVILMTYEWGYAYGSPQAISPVKRIRSVLDYAVDQIEPGKIMLGLSNYAYDWTLPWVQGTQARILSDSAALNLAISRGAPIQFDAQAAAPWFRYLDAEGRGHVVWFEDARSVQARLKLAEEYGLAGVSIWTVNNRNRPLFELIHDRFYIEKIL